MRDVVGRAARKVSDQYEDTVEYDDAFQEACIALASKGVATRKLVESGDLGLVAFRLAQDLADRVKTEAGHRSRQVSLDWLGE